MAEHQSTPTPSSETDLIPAAQYVRMSTEHQQYSTENQGDVICNYAARRGYRITHTYADDGKSGLRIEGRESLKRLIADVQSGQADFKAILVYDISRWGRFQDTDESAYYEYICRKKGIAVVYCAEQFENDGSPTATIIKSVKRAMAGEYSRELSSKVFKGQCKLIQLGYRQGGAAGFGLRRMLIDQAGQPKSLLKRGEYKSLQTDRVILVPGPDEEIEVVRWIYRMFTKEGRREHEIAGVLNAGNVQSETGRPWTRGLVHHILTSEKYIGNNVYNRVSFKLKKKRVVNSPDMWVRAENVFDPIVDPESFFTARGIIQERNRIFSNEDLVELLKQTLSRHRTLSASLIDNSDGMPSSSVSHNFSATYAKCMLAATPDDQLVDPQRANLLKGIKPEEMARMEREMETLEQDFHMIEDSHGKNTMHLVLGTGYLRKLLSSAAIVRFLSSRYPDVLAEFQKIVDSTSLDRST